MQDGKGISAPGGPFVYVGVFLELYSKLSYSSHRSSECFMHHLRKDSFNNYQITIYSALLIMGNAISDTTDTNQTKG